MASESYFERTKFKIPTAVFSDLRDNLTAKQRQTLKKRTEVPTKGARSRDGLVYLTYFWDQRWHGRRMQNVYEAFSGDTGREGC